MSKITPNYVKVITFKQMLGLKNHGQENTLKD